MCGRESGWGDATRSMSRKRAEGMCTLVNSSSGLRFALGMNQVASRMARSESDAEDLVVWSWVGERTSGQLSPKTVEYARTRNAGRVQRARDRRAIVDVVRRTLSIVGGRSNDGGARRQIEVHAACLLPPSTPPTSSMPSDQSTWLIAVPDSGDADGLHHELSSKLASSKLAQLCIPSFKVRDLLCRPRSL